MEKDRIEEILEKLGSEDVPSDVHQIADKAAGRFSEQLSEQKNYIQFKETIMRKKFMSLTIAAAVIIIVLLAGVPFFKGSGPAVTLAAVYEKIQLVNAFVYKMKMNMTGNMQPGMPRSEQKMELVVTISKQYGMRMDAVVDSKGKKLSQQSYFLPDRGFMYIIIPEQKQYMRLKFDDELVRRAEEQMNDPRVMIKKVLNCKYEDIGRSIIDSIEVEGFQTTDPAYAGGAIEDLKITLWVDIKSWLPVRAEMYAKLNEQSQSVGVIEDFEWDIPVVAGDFEPKIGEDFTALPGSGMKMGEYTEQAAVEGLRFFAENLGKYPEKMNALSFMKELSAIEEGENLTEKGLHLKEELDALSKEEKVGKMMEMMSKAYSIGGFHTLLDKEKKEPAYYGDVVGPSDADKVLMRWKSGDNEYRVIYGNLSAETVSAEKLAELESQIPK